MSIEAEVCSKCESKEIYICSKCGNKEIYICCECGFIFGAKEGTESEGDERECPE